MPFAVAILLTLVVAPPVNWLQRWVGRVPAVLAVVILVFAVLGLTGWALARQMDHLADDLPLYRANILAKIADVRGAGKAGAVEKLRETIQDIKTDLGRSDAPKRTVARPVWLPLSRSRVSPASVVSIADLPPSPASKTRYFVKRLRAAFPEVRVLVGRWAPPALADESTQALRDTGANLVASTLLENRRYLDGLVEITRIRFRKQPAWSLRKLEVGR